MSTRTDQILYVQSMEFTSHIERVVTVTDATSRLNLLPFNDSEGRAELLSVVFGASLPASVTIYPPFFTECGLNTTFGENVFVNQGCTFMDKGGIRIGNEVMIAPKVNLITGGHPLPLAERREYICLAPIVIEDDVSDRCGSNDHTGSHHRCRRGGRCRCRRHSRRPHPHPGRGSPRPGNQNDRLSGPRPHPSSTKTWNLQPHGHSARNHVHRSVFPSRLPHLVAPNCRQTLRADRRQVQKFPPPPIIIIM